MLMFPSDQARSDLTSFEPSGVVKECPCGHEMHRRNCRFVRDLVASQGKNFYAREIRDTRNTLWILGA